MDYFRQKLLTYSTEREISTLLHIHVETDKPKVLVPSTKAKNYVDQVLNQYTVKMYTYPELTPPDSRLAFNIHNQRRTGTNIFVVQESKRKPVQKKKPIRKPVLPPPPPTVSQVVRSCPCCGTKVISKHKCEHTYCQKPCPRVKKIKQHYSANPEQSFQASQRKKKANDQDDFSPDKEDLQHLQSKQSSIQDRQSDYQEDFQIVSQESSEQFASNIQKNKRDRRKGRRRIRKEGNKSINLSKQRSFPRRTSKKDSKQRLNQKEEHILSPKQMEEKYQFNEEKNHNNQQHSQVNKQIQNSAGEQLIMKKKPRLIKRRSLKRKDKQQDSNGQSEYQLQEEHKKQIKKRRNPTQKGQIPSIQQKQSEENEAQKIKKKSCLTNYCNLNELKQYLLFDIKIIDEEQQNLNDKKQIENKQKEVIFEESASLKPKESQFNKENPELLKQNSEYKEKLPESQDRNQQKNRNQQLEVEVNNNNNVVYKEYQEQPVVDAVLDPVSDGQQDYGTLFKNPSNDKMQ